MENSNGIELASPDDKDGHKPKRRVLVCQNTACAKSGALSVFQTFQALELPDIELVASGCLGQCGNGPMVLILPETIWYRYVQQQDVPTIASQHLMYETATAATVNPLRVSYKHDHIDTQQNEGDRAQFWAYVFLLLALLIVLSSIFLALAQS